MTPAEEMLMRVVNESANASLGRIRKGTSNRPCETHAALMLAASSMFSVFEDTGVPTRFKAEFIRLAEHFADMAIAGEEAPGDGEAVH